MGDIVHTLPAISDATRAMPDVQFDWVVEESFAEIPKWHPQVRRVIPVALRRWRQQLGQTWRNLEWQQFYGELREQHYDCVIDAQGLLKSAMLTRLARSNNYYGFNRHCAREGLASLAYTSRFAVPKNQHAITRTRQLFSLALAYDDKRHTTPDYGIDVKQFKTTSTNASSTQTVVFIHGSSRKNKCWPEENWVALAKTVNDAGFTVQLPWGNSEEKQRAERIAAQCASARVSDKLNLTALATMLAGASAVVTVDTGPGHLAAALNTPTVGLYGPTNPALCGVLGNDPKRHTNLHFDPGFQALTPEKVWAKMAQKWSFPATE